MENEDGEDVFTLVLNVDARATLVEGGWETRPAMPAAPMVAFDAAPEPFISHGFGGGGRDIDSSSLPPLALLQSLKK